MAEIEHVYNRVVPIAEGGQRRETPKTAISDELRAKSEGIGSADEYEA